MRLCGQAAPGESESMLCVLSPTSISRSARMAVISTSHAGETDIGKYVN